MQKINILLLLVGLLLVSCGTDNNSESESQEATEMENNEEKVTPEAPKANLLNGKWQANYIEVAPKPMEELYPDGNPTVTFNIEEKQVSGNSGCNNFTGSFSVDGNKIIWEGELASTRKMCPDMDGEKAFLRALLRANSYSITERGQTLNLIAGDMGTMRLTRVDE